MRRLRSLSKIYKCKMFTIAMQKWLGFIGLVLGVVERDKVSSTLSLFQLLGWLSYMDTSAPPTFALELAKAIVHIQVKWVNAGARPPSLSHQCRLPHTYLPVKSFIPLITGQWLYQQTASGVFLHAFYTDYMDYCISRFWCIIFYVIALKLVVQVVFLFSFFEMTVLC